MTTRDDMIATVTKAALAFDASTLPHATTIETEARALAEFVVDALLASVHDNPVPDIPCPKCGSDNVRISYQAGGAFYETLHEMCKETIPRPQRLDASYGMFGEHFHRTCQRCHYQWPTDDVIGRYS